MGDFGKVMDPLGMSGMFGNILGVGEQFDPQAPARPETYGPPPSLTPQPQVTSPAATQQEPSIIPPSNVSPLLRNVYSDVVESPATGLSLEDEVAKRSKSQTGGMGV